MPSFSTALTRVPAAAGEGLPFMGDQETVELGPSSSPYTRQCFTSSLHSSSSWRREALEEDSPSPDAAAPLDSVALRDSQRSPSTSLASSSPWSSLPTPHAGAVGQSPLRQHAPPKPSWPRRQFQYCALTVRLCSCQAQGIRSNPLIANVMLKLDVICLILF